MPKNPDEQEREIRTAISGTYVVLLAVTPLLLVVLIALLAYIWHGEKASRDRIVDEQKEALEKVAAENADKLEDAARETSVKFVELATQIKETNVQLVKTNETIATMSGDFREVRVILKGILDKDVASKADVAALRAELGAKVDGIQREQDMRTGRLDALEKIVADLRERLAAANGGTKK